MAYMFPKTIKEGTNSAECEVYKIFQLGLPEEVVCYHNYEVNNMETDFIIMLPGKGIIIIEVKSWNGHRITKIPDAEHIQYINKDNEIEVAYSPLSQCKNYTYALRNNITQSFQKRIKVIPLVCFPYMPEQVYKEKSMHIVVPRERSILKDDLEDLSQLYYVIKQKFEAKKVGGIDLFDEQTYIDICAKWFEDKQTILERLGGYKPTRKIRRLFKKRNYSILSYLKLDLEEPKELLAQQLEFYFEKWIVGTKIILIVGSESECVAIMRYLEDKIKQEMTYLTTYKAFQVYDLEKRKYKTSIFHFEVYSGQIKDEMGIFTIVDGIEYEVQHKVLELFDQVTEFNYKQYKIEHAQNEGNILVKAGAGTGKTYSMVSRIGYLYYSENYKPQDLLHAIIMITFTNDAADNMKNRLKKYFTNLAILTEETEYIEIMENISRMQISTIHALMKKIIQKNSKYLGVGNTITITTQQYETQQLIHKHLELLINRQERFSKLIGPIKKFEIRKAVEKFIDLLEKKNINLEYEQTFDRVEKDCNLFELILQVSTNVQKEIIAQDIIHNKVQLSNLTIYIDKILRELTYVEKEKREDVVGAIEYVFIDEFQDTDDITIDLIKRFYNLKPFNVFVVGDIKQSIYRFRGADDEAFSKLQSGINNWVLDLTASVEYLTLSKNYRSDTKLLRAFDKMFKEWVEGVGKFNEILKYEKSDQLIGVKNDERIDTPIKCEVCNLETFELKFIEIIKSKIKELNDKYRDKPNEKGTIAILTRNNEEVEKIRQIGEKYGYTIETAKVENLYEMAPTIDLYRLILALQYNTNAKYLYSLSLSNYAPTIVHKEVYKNKKNRQHIYKLFMQNKIIDNWAQSEEDRLAGVRDESILGSLREKTILRVIRDINEITKPWERYAAQFKEEERKTQKEYYKRNQDLLLERLIQMSNGDNLTINSIAHFLSIMIFTNQHQDERRHKKKATDHTIKCLTVHKSKGLEYDHVIIPYTTTPLDRQHTNQIIKIDDVIYTKLVIRQGNRDKDEAAIGFVSKNYYKKVNQEKEDLVKEEARILYVALTRAEDTVTWFKHQEEQEVDEEGITWTQLLDKRGEQYE